MPCTCAPAAGIARALMQRPSVLLADGPTSSLDPKAAIEIIQLLREQGVQRNVPVLIAIFAVVAIAEVVVLQIRKRVL